MNPPSVPAAAESRRLCVLTCHNFQRELAAAIEMEGWHDVECLAYPANCGRPPLVPEDLRALLPPACTDVVLLGRSCLAQLTHSPEERPGLQLTIQEYCFHLVAAPAIVDEAVERGAYLMTPAWLWDWRRRLDELGFPPQQLREYFHEFASELLLLDTGIDPDAPQRLIELGQFLSLPVARIDVGLTQARSLLRRIVAEWRSGVFPPAN